MFSEDLRAGAIFLVQLLMVSAAVEVTMPLALLVALMLLVALVARPR